MRDLFFKILPSLGETVLNFEKLGGRTPTTTSEFASVLQAFKTNIGNALNQLSTQKYYRHQQSYQTTKHKVQVETLSQGFHPPKLPDQ